VDSRGCRSSDRGVERAGNGGLREEPERQRGAGGDAGALTGACPRQAEVQQEGPIFLLDGNNMAYRAFFALPDTIATSTGFPTNALYGFCAMVLKILADYQPAVVIVGWDSREKTFRHDDFVDYKATRKPMPDLLSEQWPYFEELCSSFGFANVTLAGYEADDILGTLARQAEREDRRVVVVTGDKDMLQLVSDRVQIMANARGVTDVKLYGPSAVQERFGVPPELIPDLIGLKGDPSDNIPGVPGIGEKTAADLLARFGSVEGVLSHLDEVGGPKRRELLREHAEEALLSKRLALIECEAPIDIRATEVAARAPDRDKVKELFSRFEFNTFMERIEELFAGGVPVESGAGQADEEAPGSGSGGNLELLRLDLHELASRLPRELPVGLSEEASVSATDEATNELPALWMAWDRGGESWAGVRVPMDAGAEGPLREILRARRVVCHDLKSRRGVRRVSDCAAHDTLIAAYLLDPGRRQYPLEGALEEAGLKGYMPPQGGHSAAGRAVDVVRLAAVQEPVLRQRGMWSLFTDIELPLMRVLVDMEEAGVHLDCYRLGEIAARLQDRMEALEDRIHTLAGGEAFNLGSPAQLGEVLFERLGLPRGRKTKTGYSTDAKTLASLRGAHPIIEALESYRELSKLMSTYVLALPEAVDPATGRLHTTFHQTVAATGRLSSSDPNLQNIPIRTELGSHIRECFTAEEGSLLVVADYGQIELRLMAFLAQEPALIEAFRRGDDIHARTAAEVFDLVQEAVDPVHRRYAKAVNFGILYGISSFGLSQQLNVSREEAAEYIDRYFERLPNVRRFIDETIADAKEHGFVSTVFGRTRNIPELSSPVFQTRSLGERLAVNSVIQGSAADIIKVAMLRCHEMLAREFPAARLVLQVHDELIFEVPAAVAQSVKQRVVKEMVAAFPMDPPLSVDAGVGENWLAAK